MYIPDLYHDIAPLSEQMSRSRALYNKGKRWDFTFGRPFHKVAAANAKWRSPYLVLALGCFRMYTACLFSKMAIFEI
jgi:hypothetical protein